MSRIIIGNKFPGKGFMGRPFGKIGKYCLFDFDGTLSKGFMSMDFLDYLRESVALPGVCVPAPDGYLGTVQVWHTVLR